MIQDWLESKKASSSSQQNEIIPSSDHKPQQQNSSIPSHLQQTHKIEKLLKSSIAKILSTRKFKQADQFKSIIDVQVSETNFQSMKAQLHYGYFIMEVTVIYTEIQDKLFQGLNSASGSFGIVNFIEFEGCGYAMKGIPIQLRENQIYAEKAYKEYFLCCLADALGIGPKIIPLFGYDILLTKNMVFFAMEECDGVKSESAETLQSQLVQNLQTMHSVNFIHIDIKPDNVCYSNLMKKHVFIDFGLSKIIKDPIGEKSKTKFAGTLSYCSDEMKKCYYFQTPKFVDLYQNDFFCLKKTIQSLNSLFKQKELSCKSWCEKQMEQYDKLHMFQQIILMLRLKYYISKEKVEEVLKIIQNSKSLIVTIYQILKNPEIARFLQVNQEVQEKLNNIKNEIFAHGFQITRSDAILLEFFNNDQKSVSAEKIIPIHQIVQSEPSFFYRYLSKPELILKLFYFLQPFSKSHFYPIQNKSELKKFIVKKIYQITQQTPKQPIFFCQKLRFCFAFFYSNLRNLKYIKVLLSLRLIFISIYEWSYVANLQEDIIKAIDQPFLKMLKLTQFNLFLMVLLQNQDEQMKNQWAKLKENIKIDQNDGRLLKIMSLYDLIKIKSPLMSLKYECKISMANLISQISKDCYKTEEKQSIYLIKYLFLEVTQLPVTIFQPQTPKTLALKFYSRFFSTLKVLLTEYQLIESKLFLFTENDLKQQYFQLSSQNQMKSAIQNLIEALKQRRESFGIIIEKMLYFNFYDKRYLSFFIEKLRQNSNSIPQKTVEIDNRLYCINYCFEYIDQNFKRAVGQQKLIKQQWQNFVNQLENNFNQFIQNPAIRQKIDTSIELKVKSMIIQTRIGFQKGKSASQLKQHIEATMNILEPWLLKYQNLALHFLVLFNYLKPHIRNPDADHYSKSILIRIASAYISQKQFFLFRKMRVTLLIKIKNQFGNFEQNLELLMSMIDDFKDKKQLFIGKVSSELYVQAVNIFCATLDPSILLNIYQKLKFNQRQLKCGLYGYLVFWVYLQAENSPNQGSRLRQIIRTMLALDKMPWICQLGIKSEIFKLSENIVTYKSKRKAFIVLRLTLKNALNQNKLKILIKELKIKTQRISRKKIERVYEKLREKIRKLQKLALKSTSKQLALNQFYCSYRS